MQSKLHDTANLNWFTLLNRLLFNVDEGGGALGIKISNWDNPTIQICIQSMYSFVYCQAQPQFQLAELDFNLDLYPSTRESIRMTKYKQT